MAYELTTPQKSIWLTEKFYEGTSVNNISGYVFIKEQIDIEILTKAINNVIKTNDGMRLKFKDRNNSCVQYVADYLKVDIEIIELSSEEEVKSKSKEMAKIPFNFYDNFLFRFVIFKLPNGTGGVILCMHHIISDSWTMGLASNQVIKQYIMLLNNESEEENRHSYLEYIKDEQEYLCSNKFLKDKEYWDRMFLTVPEVASIPEYIKNINSNAGCEGNRLQFTLNEKILNKIKRYCEENKVSLYNFFMSVYSIYIGRVSGLDDFVIGTPILNRANHNQKNTIGMCVSTAPLRINLNYELSFNEFIHNVSGNTMSLLRHQKYPYQTILEDLRKKDSSIPNLYNIILSYQITKTTDKLEALDYNTEWTFNGYCADELQIHLFDLNDNNKLTIAYDYKTDKYEQEDITDLHARISTIIEQIVENNNIKLKDIEIVTVEEKNKILYEFNNTQVDYPKDKTIVDLFEEQVEKTPDNIAVVFEDEKLTYRELNEKANQLARYLIEQGVKKEDVVGIRLNKSLEMIVSIISIIKLGCCYLPINMSYPEDRVNYMLEDCKCKLLLATNNCNNIKVNQNIINVDFSNLEIYRGINENINVKISPEDLIYIIYTSGTTGKPKGAMLCHRNVVRLLKNDGNLFDFNENDIWTMFHSFAFDFSVWEMYGALLFGGKLILVNEEIAKDPQLFIKLLLKEKVTILNQTPSYFYNLIKSEENKEEHKLNIRYIIFGGEALKPNLIQNWKNMYPSTKLINMYGITETTVHVTYKELESEDFKSTSSIIGTPIPTLQILLLDKNFNIVPPGVTGEMFVGGAGVFKGYFNREDLNNQKLLILDKFGNNPIYRSADSAIMDRNLNLRYVGRIDKQIKVRGFRVEIGEIESTILNNFDIKSCIVCKKQDQSNRDVLCAYYISNNEIEIDNFRNILLKYLPNYMIPQYFIRLDKIPVNINGKVDYNALDIPSNIHGEIENIFQRNECDKKIITTYKELFKIENINISDSFFSLGGDSLIAIDVSIKLSQKFNVAISVNDILSYPIIKDLSDFISKKAKKIDKQIKKYEKCDNYPLSSAQKRIYYSCILEPDSVLYNIAGGVVLDKLLDKQKLEECFKILIKRHEALRTKFIVKDNEVVQIIEENINFKLEESIADTDNINDLYSNFVKPFDLSIAPLFNAELIKLKNNKEILLLNMHHIISDGTSLNILLRELCDLYNNKELSEKTIDYTDFALWEQEQLETDKYNKAKEFWLNQFKDEIPLLNMPYTYARPTVQSFEGDNYYAELPKDIYEKIEEISKKLNITPYILMLAIYYILLSKYTSQDDIVVGTPSIGRNNSELYNVLGMFVNTLVLRNNIDHSLKFAELCNNIKNNFINCLSNDIYQFDTLIKDLNIQRDVSRNSLFDIMFVFQSEGYKKICFDNVNSEYFIPNNNISKFDLTLEILPINNKYSLRFEYCTKLFSKDFIKRLSVHYINILNNVLDNSEIMISDIDMLSIEEKNKNLYEINNTNVDYSKDKIIVDLFEEQVEKTPDNIAVIFGDEKLTYKELNEKANQLARYLIENGIDNNSKICIMLPRSLEVFIAIMGILKTGAAYIPVDITYPEERIKYISENSQASLILSKSDVKLEDNIHIVNIDINKSDIYKMNNTQNLNIKVKQENLAYIIYTSGTTGRPKGVKICHKNIMNFVKGMCDTINFNKTIVSTTTICFDIFVLESLVPLQNGMTVVMANEEEQIQPKALNKLCEKNNVKMIQTTPSKMELFIKDENEVQFIKNMESIMVGGEAFPSELFNKLKDITNSRIYNMYGPTETTVWSSVKELTNSDEITVGTPIANTNMYVLDKDMHICPIDVVGELYIAGDGVSLGYFNNNELTNKSFVNDILDNNRKMYKTGDLARLSSDNEICCLGRKDNQVKIRGLRIELDEIEKQIVTFENIDKVVVCACKDANNRQHLVAYITVTERVAVNDLKKYLRTKLPKYMVPSYIVVLDKFDYLPNGKINKKELPSPNIIFKSTKEFVRPHNRLEADIIQVFERLLSIEPIGVHDNFFEIGGDSLLAMNLQMELSKIDINISYSDVFMYSTAKELADSIMTKKKRENYKIDKEEIEKFNTILEKTTQIGELTYIKNNNVLLTGATGFFGIHILDEILKNEENNVYCLIRTEPGLNVDKKLLNKLHYYFGNKYDNLIGKRIFVINADITDKNLGLSEEEIQNIFSNIDVVINSAGKVSHYGDYNEYKNINVDVTKNLVDFCMKYNKRFYQISTISVSENLLENNTYKKDEQYKEFKENNFYTNQLLENVYVRSKFEAEKEVLNGILNGLDGYILRVGHLMNRKADGVFQTNILENVFINKIITFSKIGNIPDYLLDLNLELTPVDYCAKAVIKIVENKNENNRIYHLFNHNYINALQFIGFINEYTNKNINIVDNNTFINIIDNMLNNEKGKNIISNIIDDFNKERLLIYDSNTSVNSNFTIKYLEKINFKWPEINKEYMQKFIEFYKNKNLL